MTPLQEVVLARRIVKADSGCWLWDRVGADGYGRAAFRDCSQIAHRAVWQLLVGPIEPGLQLDHLCRVRACVNPDHLEPVTGRENKHRSPLTVNRLNLNKTHCPQGHAYEGDNLYVRSNVKGAFRTCMTCKRSTDRANQRRYRDRRKAEADDASDLAS